MNNKIIRQLSQILYIKSPLRCYGAVRQSLCPQQCYTGLCPYRLRPQQAMPAVSGGPPPWGATAKPSATA